MGLVVLFIVALLLFAGAMFLLIRAGSRERQEDVLLRLRAMGSDDAALLDPMRRQIANPVLRWVSHLVWRTGAEIEAGTIARGLLLFLLLVPVAVFILGAIGGLLAVALLLMLVWAWLMRKATQRRIRIMAQFPAFLEGVIRVLSAGNTLEESIGAAARESADPIRPLFLSVGRQVRLGAPIETVLMDVAEINQVRDFKVMALAASINRKYGGSLRNVLRSLIQAVRTRDAASRELRALTAETRFSALVLAVIPVGLMLYIFILNPDYYLSMWADGGGRLMLIGSVVMQVAGVVVIYRMMRSTGEEV